MGADYLDDRPMPGDSNSNPNSDGVAHGYAGNPNADSDSNAGYTDTNTGHTDTNTGHTDTNTGHTDSNSDRFTERNALQHRCDCGRRV
jgi:hypothetical protein